MKKAALCILALLIIFSFLTACAADSANFAPAAPTSAPENAVAFLTAASPPADNVALFSAPMVEQEQMDVWDVAYDDQLIGEDSSIGIGNTVGSGFAERIIYTASAEIETVDFDSTIEGVHEMLRFNGGFIESSFVTGRNQWQRQFGHPAWRTANFTLRVPQDRLAPMTDSLENLGNVLSLRNEAVNITAQFVDTESRLTALRIQEERLLDMLRLTDNVADMIIIEQSLSEVRITIESMTATIRNWENQLNYSTLTLFIFEVEEYTEFVPIGRTFWQQIGDGLSWTMRDIGRFFTNLLSWFIINLPVLIILAAIAFAAQFALRKKIKKIRAKKITPAAGEKDNDS